MPGSNRQLIVGLAAVAGFIDAVGYLKLRHVFVAHMTGNASKLGIALAHVRLARAAPLALAPLLFVTAIAAGTVLADRGRRDAAFTLQGVLVAAFMVGGPFYELETVAVLALGLQTAALTSAEGTTMRTTYVSGMLTRLAQEATRRATGRGAEGFPLALAAGVWGMYVAAAALGAFLLGRWSTWCLAVPLAVLACAALVERRRRDSNPRGRDFPT